MRLSKYKMKKNPGLLRSFNGAFNYFLGVVISFKFGSYLYTISPFRGVFKTTPLPEGPYAQHDGNKNVTKQKF